MQYLKVRWLHQHPEEPIMLYSELDDSRWEVRKVEIFADGHIGYASGTEVFGSTILGDKPVPPLEEIMKDPEFEPTVINREEFERVWTQRFRSVRQGITG